MKLGMLLIVAMAALLPPPHSAFSVAQPRSLWTLIQSDQQHHPQAQQGHRHHHHHQQPGLPAPWSLASAHPREAQQQQPPRPPPLGTRGSSLPWDRFAGSARLVPALWRVATRGSDDDYVQDGDDYAAQGKQPAEEGGAEVGGEEEEEAEEADERRLLQKRGDVPTSLDLTFHLMRELLDAARAEKMVVQAHNNRKIMDSAGK